MSAIDNALDLSGSTIAEVYHYWNEHTLGMQYLRNEEIEIGSGEFFEHIQPWMNPYKFPWIMKLIEREACLLKGKHLLEIGCGMGYDSLEFLKRDVRVTATDLTPNAVKLATRHFESAGVDAEDIRVENVLDLKFSENRFDAVWANGVVHHTGNIHLALREIHRVLKPGGRAIICHFYRKPSWMYFLKQLPGVNIEFEEEDPPISDFQTEKEIEAMFEGYQIVDAAREHYRLLPVSRSGLKASLYNYILKPCYNAIPETLAKRNAYKYSVTAIKR